MLDVMKCGQENSAAKSQMEEKDDDEGEKEKKETTNNCGHGAVLRKLLQRNSKLVKQNRLLKRQLELQQVCKNCMEFKRERDFLFRKCKNYERQLEQIENKDGKVGQNEDPNSVRQDPEEAEKENETVTPLTQREKDGDKEQGVEVEASVSDVRYEEASVRDVRYEESAVHDGDKEQEVETAVRDVRYEESAVHDVRCEEALVRGVRCEEAVVVPKREIEEAAVHDAIYEEAVVHDVRYEESAVHDVRYEEAVMDPKQEIEETPQTPDVEPVAIPQPKSESAVRIKLEIPDAVVENCDGNEMGEDEIRQPEMNDEDCGMPFHEYIDSRYELEHEAYEEEIDAKNPELVQTTTTEEKIESVDGNNSHVVLPLVPASKNLELENVSSDKSICQWVGVGGKACHEEFVTMYQLMKHAIMIHILRQKKPDHLFVCAWNGCHHGEPFPSLKILFQHLREHVCNKSLIWDSAAWKSTVQKRESVLAGCCPVEKEKESLERFFCRFWGCGQEFPDEVELRRHVRAHIDPTRTHPTPYACSFDGCEKRFAQLQDFKAHTETHVGGLVAVPERDNRQGNSVVEKRINMDHLQSNLGILVPKEELPEKPTVTQPQELLPEIPVNMDTKKDLQVGGQVPQMDTSLDLAENMALEIRLSDVHADLLQPAVKIPHVPTSNAYICGWDRTDGAGGSCCMSIATWDEMVAHVMSEHVGDQVRNTCYSCLWKDCRSRGQTFRLRSNLVSHLQVHLHPGETKPFQCDYGTCKRTFAREEYLMQHKQSHSVQTDRVKCWFPGCQREFSRRDTVVAHYKAFHLGDASFKCPIPECGRVFSKRGTLRSHRRRCRKGLGGKAPPTVKSDDAVNRKSIDTVRDERSSPVEKRLVSKGPLMECQTVRPYADGRSVPSSREERGNVTSSPSGVLTKTYKRIRPFQESGNDGNHTRCTGVKGPSPVVPSYKRIRPLLENGSNDGNLERNTGVNGPSPVSPYKRKRPLLDIGNDDGNRQRSNSPSPKSPYKRIRPLIESGNDGNRERSTGVNGPSPVSSPCKGMRPLMDSGSNDGKHARSTSVNGPTPVLFYKGIRPILEQNSYLSRWDQRSRISISGAEMVPLGKPTNPDSVMRQRPDPQNVQSDRVERDVCTNGPLTKSNSGQKSSCHPDGLTRNRPITEGSGNSERSIGVNGPSPISSCQGIRPLLEQNSYLSRWDQRGSNPISGAELVPLGKPTYPDSGTRQGPDPQYVQSCRVERDSCANGPLTKSKGEQKSSCNPDSLTRNRSITDGFGTHTRSERSSSVDGPSPVSSHKTIRPLMDSGSDDGNRQRSTGVNGPSPITPYKGIRPLLDNGGDDGNRERSTGVNGPSQQSYNTVRPLLEQNNYLSGWDQRGRNSSNGAEMVPLGKPTYPDSGTRQGPDPQYDQSCRVERDSCANGPLTKSNSGQKSSCHTDDLTRNRSITDGFGTHMRSTAVDGPSPISSHKRIRPLLESGSNDGNHARSTGVNGPSPQSYNRIRPLLDNGGDDWNRERSTGVNGPLPQSYNTIRPLLEQNTYLSRWDQRGSNPISGAEKVPLAKPTNPDSVTQQRPHPQYERDSSTNGPLTKSNGEQKSSSITDGFGNQRMTMYISNQVERGPLAKITSPGFAEGPLMTKSLEAPSKVRSNHEPVNKVPVLDFDAWKSALTKGPPVKSNTTEGRSHIWPVASTRRRSLLGDGRQALDALSRKNHVVPNSQMWRPIGHSMAVDTRPLPSNPFRMALEMRFGPVTPPRERELPASCLLPFPNSEPSRISPTKKKKSPIKSSCPNRTLQRVPIQNGPNVVYAGNGPADVPVIEKSYGCPYSGCGQVFKNSGDRAVHRRQAHPR